MRTFSSQTNKEGIHSESNLYITKSLHDQKNIELNQRDHGSMILKGKVNEKTQFDGNMFLQFIYFLQFSKIIHDFLHGRPPFKKRSVNM